MENNPNSVLAKKSVDERSS